MGDDHSSPQSDSTLPKANLGSKDLYLPPVPANAKRLLYLSHGLACWGARAWEFAVGLVLFQLFQPSLRVVSIYGLASAVGSVVFGPAVGTLIDRNPRLRVVSIFYFLQNAGLGLAAVSSLTLLMLLEGGLALASPLAVGLTASIIVWGVCASVGFTGSTVSVEKEWVRALCGDDNNELAKMNSTMRSIDLGCMIVAPLLTGNLMTWVGTKVALIQIAAFNLLAWTPEVLFAKHAQKVAPQLQRQTCVAPNMDAPADPSLDGQQDVEEPLITSFKDNASSSSWDVVQSLATYYKQKCSMAMLALALLYLNFMSLGILMTSYLKWLGMTEAELSVYRGAGAVAGVLGATTFPFLRRKLGLGGTGLVGLIVQLVALGVAAIPTIYRAIMGFEEASSLLTMHLLVVGLVCSRYGLWTFDLSVSQTIQVTVNRSNLGTVGAVQKMHENFFFVILYIIGVVVHKPEDFVWLIAGSLGLIAIAVLFYVIDLGRKKEATVELA